MGDSSTHVISKLGLPSVAHSPVRLFFNADASAGFLSPGWELKAETALSANGGNDTLVKMGDLACGLYLVEFDFSNVDAAARQIFRKADDVSYAQDKLRKIRWVNDYLAEKVKLAWILYQKLANIQK